jgi:hypothetical protein
MTIEAIYFVHHNDVETSAAGILKKTIEGRPTSTWLG